MASAPATDPAVTSFDLSRLEPRQAYKLLISTVVPRPIAWVTSVDPEGVVNAAPYSFFNVLSSDPPIIALGIDSRPDGPKDTAANIRITEEFTVNIVSHALAEQMSITAIAFPSQVDELAAAGLTAVPGQHVRSPRIAECPVALECKRFVGIGVGRREIVLGTVLAIHVQTAIVDAERFHVDPAKLDALGRMGGHGYASTRDYFDMATLSVDDWQAGQRPKRRLHPE